MMDVNDASLALEELYANEEAYQFFIKNEFDEYLYKALYLNEKNLDTKKVNAFVNASYILAYKKNHRALDYFKRILEFDYDAIDMIVGSFRNIDDFSRCIASVAYKEDFEEFYSTIYKEEVYVGIRRILGIAFVSLYIEGIISYDDMKDILDKFLEFPDMIDITVLMIMSLSIGDLFGEVEILYENGVVDESYDELKELKTIEEIRKKFKNQLGFITFPLKALENKEIEIFDEVYNMYINKDIDGLKKSMDGFINYSGYEKGLKASYASYYVAILKITDMYEDLFNLLFSDEDYLALILDYYADMTDFGRILASIMPDTSYIDKILDVLYQSENINVKSIALDMLMALYSERVITDSYLREIVNDIFYQSQDDYDFIENISIFALMIRDDDLYDDILGLINDGVFDGSNLNKGTYYEFIEASIEDCQKEISKLGFITDIED